MKKVTLIIAAIVMIAGLTSKSFAQNSATANAGVKIVKALTLTKTADLHFGTMTIPTAGVVISLSTANARTADVPGNITLLPQAPIAANAAYTVAGSADATYAITLPSGDVTINGPGMAYTIVNNFVAKTASAGIDGLTGTLNGMGHDSFVVGANLNLAGSQAFGIYSGTFDVTVNYN